MSTDALVQTMENCGPRDVLPLGCLNGSHAEHDGRGVHSGKLQSLSRGGAQVREGQAREEASTEDKQVLVQEVDEGVPEKQIQGEHRPQQQHHQMGTTRTRTSVLQRKGQGNLGLG